MVDGATRRRLIRTTPFAQRFADRRLQIAFDPSIQSFHSILPFESLTPQKKNEVLYKSSPGIRTHDLPHPRSKLRIDDLERSTTVG